MPAFHEPFSDLAGLGRPTSNGSRSTHPWSFLAWLADQTPDFDVFLRDTPNRRHHELLADGCFLAEPQRAFRIRRLSRAQTLQRSPVRVAGARPSRRSGTGGPR